MCCMQSSFRCFWVLLSLVNIPISRPHMSDPRSDTIPICIEKPSFSHSARIFFKKGSLIIILYSNKTHTHTHQNFGKIQPGVFRTTPLASSINRHSVIILASSMTLHSPLWFSTHHYDSSLTIMTLHSPLSYPTHHYDSSLTTMIRLWPES